MYSVSVQPFIKTEDEIGRLKESGKRLAGVLQEVIALIRPGMTTLEIDQLAEKLIRAQGGIPIFKGYGSESGKPFPGSVCTSLNEEVVHGIPREERILKDGDLLKIDIGMRFEGMVSDMARTVPIGAISPEAQRLLEVTQASLRAGIAAIKPGARMTDYARAVQHAVEQAGFSVVRDLVGHSVGRELHEDLSVPNYVTTEIPDFTFEPGMTLALEPMVNQGSFEVLVGPDQWTFITKDGGLSAHFEDTIVVTRNGAEVLTVTE